MRAVSLQHITALEQVPEPVRVVDRIEDLGRIADDGTEAIVWNRSAPHPVLQSLAEAPLSAVASGRFWLPADEANDCLSTRVLREDGLGQTTRRWLAADVGRLARQFAQILKVSHILLRIEWVCDDACRRFHRDAVSARLICTYRGPGTQFGAAEEGGQPARIETVSTGRPILLKGKLWPGFSETPVLHRSPPIEGTGVSRLVVVINEASPERP